MISYCTATKTEKYSDIYLEGTVTYTRSWHDEPYKTEGFGVTSTVPIITKPIKFKTKDIEDFLRKKLWQKEQFKRRII